MIDVSIVIGGSPRHLPVADYRLDAAVRELHTHGVSAALVASRTGATYRQEVGNDIVLAAAGSAHGVRLYPVASLNPVQFLDWPAELERALAAGAVAVRFWPDTPFASEAFRVMAEAVRGRCALLVPVVKFGDASAIGAATAELGSPVVLLGGHYSQLGDCLAALARWPHLYLETSRLAHFRAIETCVSMVGAERLLFGSGAPARPIQAALNAVLSAEIADDDRRAILAGNASRLFGLPLEPFELPAPTGAANLIDVHGHFGALGLPTPRLEPREQVAEMAKYGIVHTFASSLRAIADDLAVGNAEAFDAVGDGLQAYVVVNSNDLEGSCAAMDDAYGRDVAVGAKLHCSYNGQPTASRACLALMREVARRERPLKIHVDGAGWDDALASIAREYPTWKVIVAHAGPGTPARESACLGSNVYVELSTSFPDLPIARELVRRVGPDRVLFGSDAPLLEPAYVLGLYADAGVDLARTTDVAREVFAV